MQRNEVLTWLEESGAAVEDHGRAPIEDHDKTYGAGKWTVRQMMAHIADVEMINLWRFLRAVAEPGSPVEVFDENVWAANLDYGSRPLALSSDLFAASRRLLLHHVATLPDERLASSCEHPEKGAMTGWEWARLIHEHCLHHLGQIEAARAGQAWVPPPRTERSWRYMGEPPPDQR